MAPVPPYPVAWEQLQDAGDWPIWAVAKAGNAQYIVSENRRDFPPRQPDGRHAYEGVEYLTGQDFLALILGTADRIPGQGAVSRGDDRLPALAAGTRTPALVEEIANARLEEVVAALKRRLSVSLRTLGSCFARAERGRWVFTCNPSQELGKPCGWASAYCGEVGQRATGKRHDRRTAG